MVFNTEFTLDHLLAPFSVQNFIDDKWGQKPFIITRNNSAYYKNLFSFADFDRLLFIAQDRPQELLTIVPKGNTGKEIKARLNHFPVHELYRRFDAGDTIRISGLELCWHPLYTLIQGVAKTLNAKVDVNVYMTPTDSQGFPTHVDHEDVFILQVDGSKEWFVYEADYPWPLEGLSYVPTQGGFSTARREESSLRLAERVVLEAGDFLYIPRGYPHHALTSGRPSLHLTIGIHPIYWLDLARAALELACENEPALRRSLPPSFTDPSTWPEIVSELRTTLHKALESASLEEAVRAVVAKLDMPSNFAPDGHFASLASMQDLTPASTLERRKGLFCSVEESDNTGAAIRFGHEKLKGPVAILSALEFVRDNLAFRIEDLPGPLDPNSKIVLARRLIRAGLLRIAKL